MTHSPGEVPHGLPVLSIFPDSAGDAQGDVADSRVCYNGRMDDVFEVFGAVYPEAGRPALTRQRVAWARERPLAGLTVLDATPLFRNTLLKHACLLAAGAEVWVGYGRAMPHDPAVAARLGEFGLRVPDAARLTRGFDVVLDCAAAFADVPARLGRAELTRSGAVRYCALARTCPVIDVDASRIKTFETALGTGDGLIRGLRHFGVGELRGKVAVVFGCGKVGRGILFRLARAGARCFVVDPAWPRPPRGVALAEAPGTLLRREADLVVTATGVKDAAAPYAADLLAGHAILANMGVEDEFGAGVPAGRVLNAKAPLNFALEDPTRMRYIDPTLALHNLAATRLAAGGLPPGLCVPAAADEAAIWAALPQPLLDELVAFEAEQEA